MNTQELLAKAIGRQALPSCYLMRRMVTALVIGLITRLTPPALHCLFAVRRKRRKWRGRTMA